MYNYKKENIPRSSFSGHYLIFLSCVNASAVSLWCRRQRDGRGQMETDVLLLPEGSRGYGQGRAPLAPQQRGLSRGDAYGPGSQENDNNLFSVTYGICSQATKLIKGRGAESSAPWSASEL